MLVFGDGVDRGRLAGELEERGGSVLVLYLYAGEVLDAKDYIGGGRRKGRGRVGEGT